MKRFVTLLSVLAISVLPVTSALAVQDTVTVTATVAQGSPSIAIYDAQTGGSALTSINFGTVPNTASDHRTKQLSPSGGAWVEYFSGGGAFEIRAWYDNFPTVDSDPTRALAGLKATVGGTEYYWPHKIWTMNFGPSGATEGADPDNDTYWTQNYIWVFERAYKVDGFGDTGLPSGYPPGIYKNETRSRLVWFYADGTPVRPGSALDARLPSRFRIDVAIDALDAQYVATTATTYSGTLVLDLTQTP